MIYLHMKTNSSVFWFDIVFAIIYFVFYSLSFLYLSLHQCIIPLSVKMCLFSILFVYFINIIISFTQIIFFNGMYIRLGLSCQLVDFVSPMLYFDACIHGFLSLFKKKKKPFFAQFFLLKKLCYKIYLLQQNVHHYRQYNG